MNPQYNPQQPGSPYNPSTQFDPVAQMPSNVQLDFIRKTYVLFMAGIVTAVVMGALTLNVYGLLYAAVQVISTPILAILLIVGGSFAAQALATKPSTAYPALFGFTALIGWLFAPILALYAPEVVGQAAVLTTILFGCLTAYVFVTRKDFSFLGGIAFVGIVGVIVAGAVMAFVPAFRNSAVSYWMAWATVFFSSCFVLYRTSNMLQEHVPGQEASAALGLFISFFNIFMAVLRILGGSRR